MFRKVRASLNKTGIVTWEQHVLPQNLKAMGVRLHSKLDCYELPNGSVFDMAGMDNPEKIKSGEWDIAYGQEVTECDESDWELVSSRLRWGVMPYQMLIGDCNPSHPMHWVRQRCMTQHPDPELRAQRPGGTLSRMVEVLHRDNPRLWDPVAEEWTEYGKKYLGRLRSMTGVNRRRYYEGLWVAAEGLVYEEFMSEIHEVDPLPPGKIWPTDWKRVWAFDFGFTAPFVWQQWVIAGHDVALYNPKIPPGAMILDKEVYLSRTLVEDIARDIRNKYMDVWPTTVVCDHDAEDRATLERHLGVLTHPAYKDIQTGIQAVKERLRHDIRTPMMYFKRGSLVHDPDPYMVLEKKPTCTVQEISGYQWNKSAGNSTLVTQAALKRAEYPVMINDHGCDTMKYAVAALDIVGVSDGFF